MKDPIGKHIGQFEGSSRLIVERGDEALVLERYGDHLGFYICALENRRVTSFTAYQDVAQAPVRAFVTAPAKGKAPATGIRVGALRKNGHRRRIVVLKKRDGETHYVKIEEGTKASKGWKSNGSGWVPVADLSHRAKGMTVFMREVEDEDLVEINRKYTKQGIFWLRDGLEVYIESVKKSFAFGKVVPEDA
jgi:predicted RNA-binding protein with TRAM domain